jgi:endonuclease/exonuclease/phosphatase family metal-dependent hydrolase
MKLIQVNGWIGRLSAPLLRLIQEENPDFVCMQEALAPNAQSLEVFKDQYEFSAELITKGAFPHHFFAPAWGIDMGETVLDLGNLILSKHPLTDEVSFHTFGEYHHKTLTKAIRNTRIWQACRATLPAGKSLSVSNYQGYLTVDDPAGDAVTTQTLGKVRDGLDKLPKPLVFCGDLNITPDSEPLKVLEPLGLINLTKAHGVKTTLSEAHRAPQEARESVACDYIFVSPDIKVAHFEVSEKLVSDHKALIVEFGL